MKNEPSKAFLKSIKRGDIVAMLFPGTLLARHILEVTERRDGLIFAVSRPPSGEGKTHAFTEREGRKVDLTTSATREEENAEDAPDDDRDWTLARATPEEVAEHAEARRWMEANRKLEQSICWMRYCIGGEGDDGNPTVRQMANATRKIRRLAKELERDAKRGRSR